MSAIVAVAITVFFPPIVVVLSLVLGRRPHASEAAFCAALLVVAASVGLVVL